MKLCMLCMAEKKGKKGALALKLDISKAYDKVEWSFLKGMMIKLGFPQGWIDQIMSCVTTSSFSIHLNDKAYGNFKPARGIHQGDLLSPYLFLIFVEAFTSLLAREEENGQLHGVSIVGMPLLFLICFFFLLMTLPCFVKLNRRKCR